MSYFFVDQKILVCLKTLLIGYQTLVYLNFLLTIPGMRYYHWFKLQFQALAATSGVKVVLENMSCQGNTIGGDFNEIRWVYKFFRKVSKIGSRK